MLPINTPGTIVVELLLRRLIDIHTMLYICCPSYRGWMVWLPPGLCSGNLFQGLDMLYAMFGVVLCWFVRLWWVGVSLMFLRVTSLCGVTWLISSGVSGCSVSSVRALLFWVAL